MELENIGESLHTALRKCCDSKATTAAWNLLYILKTKNWNNFVDTVEAGFKDFELPKALLDKHGKKGEDKLIAALAVRLREVLLKWEPYGQGHDVVAFYCLLHTFTKEDWHGFASFLPYSIVTKQKEGVA